MLHRIPRSVRWVLLVAVLGAITASVMQSWTAGAPGVGGWQQTQWGPLSPADRDLLIKVRQAGLWEAPTGQQMAQQATNPQVKETGQHLAEQHAVLDQIVRGVADKLDVQLPSSPTAQQVSWMNQISAATGDDYDRTAVQIVRIAHGIVLPVIAEVRVSTRNSEVRAFADTAFQYVTTHIAMLEATGLVDYSALPAPPSPGLFSGAVTLPDLIVPAVVFLACIGAATGLVVTLRRGRKKKASGPAAPATGSQLASLHAQPMVTIPEPRERRRATLPVGGSPEVSQTGGHRRRRSRSGSDTGGFRRDDSGAFRWDDALRTDTPADLDTGAIPTQATDSGSFRTPRRSTETGRTRAAHSSDTGGYRSATAVSDSQPMRRVRPAPGSSDSGNFRFDDLLGDSRDDRSPQTPTRGMTR
jgi:predicted outer membrane protein